MNQTSISKNTTFQSLKLIEKSKYFITWGWQMRKEMRILPEHTSKPAFNLGRWCPFVLERRLTLYAHARTHARTHMYAHTHVRTHTQGQGLLAFGIGIRAS